MKNIVFLLLGLLMLVSCQTDLDIPFPEHQPKLTLNGYLVENGPLFLYVTRSFSALEDVGSVNDTSILIKDATAEVFRNGERLGELEFIPSGLDTFLFQGQFGVDTFFNFINNNVYVYPDTTVKPKAGDEFEFKVNHPTYGTATVKTTVVPKPEILGVELVTDSIVTTDFDGYQDSWSALKIRVQDPGDISNFYGLKGFIYTVEEYEDGLGGVIKDSFNYPILISTEIVRDGGGTIFGNSRPLADTDFNGQEAVLYGWVRLPGCCGYPTDILNRPQTEVLKIDAEALLIDEDFGVYQDKRQLQSESRTEGIEGAILPREPVSVVGNVEGGYGLVGSFNFRRITYDF
ncbi:MAG: DUF4249 domain-containing protein [Bacteroidia bacterium]|nr:DUF4249 domain-containing protein [Bacteroidia bacterium]